MNTRDRRGAIEQGGAVDCCEDGRGALCTVCGHAVAHSPDSVRTNLQQHQQIVKLLRNMIVKHDNLGDAGVTTAKEAEADHAHSLRWLRSNSVLGSKCRLLPKGTIMELERL